MSESLRLQNTFYWYSIHVYACVILVTTISLWTLVCSPKYNIPGTCSNNNDDYEYRRGHVLPVLKIGNI